MLYKYNVAFQRINKKSNEIVTLQDDKGNNTAHLVGILYFSLKLMKNGIKPIWIFDGIGDDVMPEKYLEIDKRKALKEFNLKRKEESISENNLENALKYSKRSTFLSKNDIENTIELVK